MKIRYLKHHLHHQPGEEVETEDNIANYLLKVRVATLATPDDKEIKKTLNHKLKSTKKKK